MQSRENSKLIPNITKIIIPLGELLAVLGNFIFQPPCKMNITLKVWFPGERERARVVMDTKGESGSPCESSFRNGLTY